MKFEVYYQPSEEANDEPDPILEFSARNFAAAIKIAEHKVPADGRAWILQRRGEDRLLPGAREDLLLRIRSGKAKFKKRVRKRNKAKVDIDRGSDEFIERFLAELPED